MEFKAVGPFPLIPERHIGGRVISPKCIETFWKGCNQFRTERGCYVFARQGGKGYTPWYVGLSAKSCFEKEIFTSDKILKYYNAMSQWDRGTPVVFFLLRSKSTKGATNRSAILQLERFLIERAFDKNPKLINKQHAKEPSWSIKHVIRDPSHSRPTREAQSFKRLMNMGPVTQLKNADDE